MILVILRLLRGIRRHFLIVALIAIQLAVNAFILLRMADMESRLGSSLFSACNAEQSIKSMKNSIVRIASEVGEGTGMIIREDGYILTNSHVIAEDPSPKIIFSDYSFKTSKVIFRDSDKDIAVLKVDGSGYIPFTFGDPEALAPRTAMYSVGFPLGTELLWYSWKA
jgi:S1-C subfamily serine protease